MSAILTAFAEASAAYASLYDLPSEATDEEADVFHDRIDAAHKMLKATPASTAAEAAAKLRVALTGIDQDREDALIAYGIQAGDELTDSDFYTDLLFATIRDLEKMSSFDIWNEVYDAYVTTREVLDNAGSDITKEQEEWLLGVYRVALSKFMETPAPHAAALQAKLRHTFEVEPDVDDNYKAIILRDAARLAGSALA